MRPPFAFFALDLPAIEVAVKRVMGIIESEDLSSWQRIYDLLAGTKYDRPRVISLGAANGAARSILEYCRPGLTRDAIPQIDEPLADALRLFVETTAELALRGGDELRGHFIDWLPSAGFIRAPQHIAQRDALDDLLFLHGHSIPEPFDFLEVPGSTSLFSLLQAEDLDRLLAAEANGGLLAHLATEVSRSHPDSGRDYALLLPFIKMCRTGGFGLYYRE
jgi:hypothetical protein